MADEGCLVLVRIAADESVDRDEGRWGVDYLGRELCQEPARDCRLWASGEEGFADAAKCQVRQDEQRWVAACRGDCRAVIRVCPVARDGHPAWVRRDRYDGVAALPVKPDAVAQPKAGLASRLNLVLQQGAAGRPVAE
jgi:hypothetical protein